jgi:hypothetical protein
MLAATGVLLIGAVSSAATPGVRGRITDPAGLPLPGVIVTLARASVVPRLTAVTNEEGVYVLDAPAGRYRLRAELAGFQPVERRDVVVADGPVVIDFFLAMASFQERVTVSAEAMLPMMGRPAPEAPITVTREVFDSAMLPNSQYDDVLPLMPNVVRGPDGLISVAGARASQGALLINGFNETDPITGEAGVMLPLEAIDSVQVYSAGYPASFGRATGGVTSVVTRSGGDHLHVSASSFFPRMLFTNGSIHGVEFWEPNVGVSGPLVKERVYFEEGVSYRFDRNRFSTLVGPQNSKFTALLSWTQIDLQVSPSQHVVASISFDPQKTERAHITAFTPAASAPRLDQGGWSASLSDRMTRGRSSLDVRGSVIHSGLSVVPGGIATYELTHDLLRGNYFDHRDLGGRRLEVRATYTWTGSGDHLLQAGTSVGRAALDGLEESAPVNLLRGDGTLGRRITFLAGQPIAASTYEIGVFGQDTWRASPWLTIDAGLRYERTTAAADATVAPRVGWTIKLADSGSSFTGSAGWFADKLVPGALTFAAQQPRAIQISDAAGAPLGSAIVYRNVLSGALRTPRAARWDVDFDHQFADGWLTRLKYQERRGQDELVINPGFVSDSIGVLALGSTGTSSARSVETTVGYRAPHARHEIYVSYVHSATRGDLNSFDAIQGPFREPFVQRNETGPLPMDVPNRMLAWGLFHLPARFTVAPFGEIRDGFPYSPIGDDWTYVGPRDSARLPWFASLDLYVNTIVGLPGHLPHARVGLKLYNLASAHSARDVQRDVARPDFATTYNPVPRDFTMVFELLWGHR